MSEIRWYKNSDPAPIGEKMYHISKNNQAPYYLLRVKVKRGHVYYYRTRDPLTGKLRKISTGQTDARSAVLHCEELLKNNELIPEKEFPVPKQVDSPKRFGTYFKDWFDWPNGEEPKCPYIKTILIRGGHYSPTNAGIQRGYFKKYIEVTFKNFDMDELTTGQIEEWLLALPKIHGIASKTALNIYSVLRVMMTEAYRLQVIPDNPCTRVKPIFMDTKKRDIPSLMLVATLFRHDLRKTLWRDQKARTGALLACLTGMRSGEIRGLQVDSIQPDKVIVRHGLDNRTLTLKETKTRQIREIPIPQELYRLLMIEAGDNKGFLFSFENGISPVNGKFFQDNLKYAIGKVMDLQGKGEVPESPEKSENRKISMHSFRGFLNSLLLVSGIPKQVVTGITGHMTDDMVEHYRTFKAEFYSIPQGQTVPQIQEWLFSCDMPKILEGGNNVKMV